MEIVAFLLVLLTATRVFGEIAVRLGQPAMVGEVISGVVLGFAVGQVLGLGIAPDQFAKSDAFIAVTGLGAFFIMLQAGLEMQPHEIAETSKRAFFVALGGFVIPLIFGFGLGWAFLPESSVKIVQCLLLGTAFAITAVAVSVRLLMDVGGLHSRFGKVIVSAAIFDDVFGLVLLAALTAFLRTGNLLSIEGYAILVGKVILFFALAIALGKYAFPMIGRLMRWMREPEAELGILLIAALAYAALAELLGMHFIMGAFMAGLFFGRRTVNRATYQAVRVKLAGITTGFLAPVFFAAIGFQANLAAVREVPVFVVLFVLLAFLGKLAGAGLAARFTGLSTREALCVGAGMSSRGAVELVIADIALKSGLFAKPVPTPLVVSNMYSTIVLMAVVTTLAAPIALRYLLHDHPRGSH